jgi:uncharacterized protein YaeQ
MQQCHMALRSTIFKIALDISDIDRGYYQSHALTVARHPSETDERMMVRVLAYALNANELLEFGKGLSSDDEPALWERDLTGNISHWIEVGLPDERVLRRACGRADRVTLYAYGNGRTIEMWWQQHGALLAKQTKLSVFAVSSMSSKALAAMAERTLDLQCMMQEGVVWMSDASDRFEVAIETLQARVVAN